MKLLSLFLPSVVTVAAVSIAAGADSGNAYVKEVIDGDTFVIGDGSKVRLIGIDTPEVGEPCAAEATAELRRMIEHRTVTLTDPSSVQDEDRYSRALRYVDTELDPATSLLRDGLAVARYDSRDGYDRHPRQPRYRALEALAIPECPTLDRESVWFGDPDGYRAHLEKRARLKVERTRLARAQRKMEQRERRIERRMERIERRFAAQADRQEQLERDRLTVDSDPVEPLPDPVDEGYTGPRCYAPGGQTWTPC